MYNLYINIFAYEYSCLFRLLDKRSFCKLDPDGMQLNADCLLLVTFLQTK